MKWSWMFSASVALSGMMGSAEAGLFGLGGCKSCGCAEDCQPAVCKPSIARPCHTNVYTYQRKCSDIKPPCCDDSCGADGGCGPVSCSAPGDLSGNGCGNGAAPGCNAPAGCAVGPDCAAPAGEPGCAAPCGDPSCAAPSCAAPAGEGCVVDPSCAAPSCAAPAGEGCVVDPSCAAPAGDGCGSTCGEGCDEDACEIAKLIYTSMTDCYAKNRRNALDELGDYDCSCHPEIMNAFVYGLNDTDERVRREAADEIGDAVRSNSCCCSPTTVAALSCALADCDRGVRHQAEEALEACGYEIVDGNCDSCTEGCANGACGAVHTAAPATAAPEPVAPAAEAVPAPAPPAEPQAFFPSRLHKKTASKSGLAGLFGMNR